MNNGGGDSFPLPTIKWEYGGIGIHKRLKISRLLAIWVRLPLLPPILGGFMTKAKIKQLLEENLEIEMSTERDCCCCEGSTRLILKVKFDNDVVCSDFIYLSSIKG